MKVVFASRNKGKIKEVKAILEGVDVLSLDDIGFEGDVEETGSTFEENSLIKAQAVFDFCHLPVIADDSGLIVEALGGAPGVMSARYAGGHGNDADNRKLLLKNLQGVEDRKAKFVTVATFIDEFGKVTQALGQTEGVILEKETGANGFGYDSLFLSDDLGISFGVADDEQKKSVSHRARAFDYLFKKTGLGKTI